MPCESTRSEELKSKTQVARYSQKICLIQGESITGQPDSPMLVRVIKFQGFSLRVRVDKAAGADAIGSVTVTNPDGVAMALTGLTDAEVSISGTLTVNDVQVGMISGTDSGLAIIRVPLSS